MKKFCALAAMVVCFGMIGCWEYDWKKCYEDDIIIGAVTESNFQLLDDKAETQSN